MSMGATFMSMFATFMPMGATFNTNHWEEHRFVMIFFPLTAGEKW
jgi:hypothetical protein